MNDEEKNEASVYANSRELSSGFVKKPTKRERVMALYWQAVSSLSVGPAFSDCKRDLLFALHAKWSLQRKIQFFERVIDDARRGGNQ